MTREVVGWLKLILTSLCFLIPYALPNLTIWILGPYTFLCMLPIIIATFLHGRSGALLAWLIIMSGVLVAIVTRLHIVWLDWQFSYPFIVVCELALALVVSQLHSLSVRLRFANSSLKEAQTAIQQQALTDGLTGLPNHRALQSALEGENERARRHGRPFSVLFFDGDRFKRINDTYGHAVGDTVLREIGQRAKSILRAGDTLGRFGGEEFLVLLPETAAEEARQVAERLRKAVGSFPLATGEVEGGITVTVSIGLASYPADSIDINDLQAHADLAMYWAKRLGRNQVRTVEEAIRAERDATLKAATAHALERQELVVQDGMTQDQGYRIQQLGLVYSLMGALDVRDPGMSEHAHEVGDIVAGMARLLNFDQEGLFRASTAAFLHDIGKIALPDQLLHKPRGQFTEQEWRLMRQHAELGANIVAPSPWLADLAPAIRHHHERWDGAGIPDGLQGEEIPLEARMITLAEAYHSMISDRPYQVGRSSTIVLDEIQRRAGSQFDPALVSVLMAVLQHREAGEGTAQESTDADLSAMV
ncbi:MAG TPA: diguanylate cyclase [Ktedonobacteraceae bacterium]|nr:diguanylate cyclase [Ktedonobacteraceae bacterium]